MTPKQFARKSMTWIFSGGATIAIGFLSFAGMFVLTSSFAWCATAFMLAAAYEGQVNDEGISAALRRMLGKKYLRQGIIRQFIEAQLEGYSSQNEIQNGYLKDYFGYQEYIKKLEALNHLTPEQKVHLLRAKKQLRLMESFLLRQLEEPNNQHRTAWEESALLLLRNNRVKLLREMNRKAWLIRFSWIFAIAAGISSGLATYSAMQVGVTSFAVLNIIPGVALITLSALAAVGYTLLLYQTISDMVQEYSGKIRSYFMKRENESRFTHVLRCTATVVAVAIALFGTLATAGSWWYAAKNGASLLGMADKAADIIRTVTVGIMALPTFVFGAANSVSSIDDIANSSYGSLLSDMKKALVETWRTESFFQFINPIRFTAKIISTFGTSILFLGHIISVSLMSDRSDSIPPGLSIVSNAAGEALTDLNYLPDEKKGHAHTSKLLLLLFAPVIATVTALKIASVLWDALSTKSLAKSWRRIFPKPTPAPNPETPTISDEWRKQQVIETCHHIEERLQNDSEVKVRTVQRVKTICEQNDSMLANSVGELEKASVPLSQHRFSFWGKNKPTRSQQQMNDAFDELRLTSKQSPTMTSQKIVVPEEFELGAPRYAILAH